MCRRLISADSDSSSNDDYDDDDDDEYINIMFNNQLLNFPIIII